MTMFNIFITNIFHTSLYYYQRVLITNINMNLPNILWRPYSWFTQHQSALIWCGRWDPSGKVNKCVVFFPCVRYITFASPGNVARRKWVLREQFQGWIGRHTCWSMGWGHPPPCKQRLWRNWGLYLEIAVRVLVLGRAQLMGLLQDRP